MKNNKGFMGMGVLLAIIAVLVIGGGAYYMGKSSNILPKTDENKKVVNNQKNSESKIKIAKYRFTRGYSIQDTNCNVGGGPCNLLISYKDGDIIEVKVTQHNDPAQTIGKYNIPPVTWSSITTNIEGKDYFIDKEDPTETISNHPGYLLK